MLDEFIPYGRHQIIQDDIDSVVNVLKNHNLTQGDQVPKFELGIIKKVSSKYAIAVNSATSALHLSCLALGVNNKDYVWTSPISFVASANCALYCGAKVDFVDIDPSTGLISMDSLKKKLESAKLKNCLPKVFIPVHLGGASCEMKEIYKLSKIYGFYIIEDASHAIGGRYNNQPVGNCKYSSITVFSFHPVKIITSGEGGMVTTNDLSLANKIKKLRSHGIVKNPEEFLVKEDYPWKYEQQMLGFNYRMNDIQASLGISQLKRLEDIVIERNRQLTIYKDIFSDTPLTFQKVPKNVYSSFHLAIIKIPKEFSGKYLDIFKGIRSLGVGIQLHYIPIYKHPFFAKFKFNKENFPGAEDYASRSISIPLFPGLEKKHQYKVKEAFDRVLL